MDGELEFPAQLPRLLRRDARDEDALFVFQEAAGDFQDLLRRFARAEDDFGKTLAQRAVRVHLREAEVGEGRGLEGAQHLVPVGFASAKFLQQTNCFNGSHGMKIPQKPRAVTPESKGGEIFDRWFYKDVAPTALGFDWKMSAAIETEPASRNLCD